MLRIRLQRFGKKRAPIYRISVIEKAQKRQGKPVEVLGFYDPRSKLLVYNTERAQYWRGVGAQASETVQFLLSKEPIHDLKDGPYEFKAQPRSVKEQAKLELIKASTKNTKSKKKQAKAETEAATKAQEPEAAKEEQPNSSEEEAKENNEAVEAPAA